MGNIAKWVIEGSWFPVTRVDLNLVNRVIAPRVGHRLIYAALGVRVLGKLEKVLNSDLLRFSMHFEFS